MTLEKNRKLGIQEGQYAFPYHYIPNVNASGSTRRYRVLRWGFEYLCYQNHLIEVVQSMRPDSVLEVGCGDGYFIGGLDDYVKVRVGADFSAKAIGFAKAFHPNVLFHVGDAAELQQQFDVVVAIEVLEHIPDDQVLKFLQMLFDRTKSGGHVIICVPSVVLPLNRKHFRHYTARLLLDQVVQAYPAAELIREEHLCHIPFWMRLYDKITVNRFWFFDISLISNWLWRMLWTRYRIADPQNGRHIVGSFRKPRNT
jgi:SAM-dependent methyltransferase